MLKKLGRYREPRIDNLETYPKKYACLRVAAEYLEIDIRTLDAWIDDGTIEAVPYGKHRRIAIEELRRFHMKHPAA